MIPCLLDVHVLLALADPVHMFHEAAHRWFKIRGRRSWATCPITENAFVRIASHPSYGNRPGDAPVVLAALRQLCSLAGHEFWPDDVSLRDLLSADAAITSGQLTDAYLLGLAVAHGGRLASFDQRVPTAAIIGGRDALELISS